MLPVESDGALTETWCQDMHNTEAVRKECGQQDTSGSCTPSNAKWTKKIGGVPVMKRVETMPLHLWFCWQKWNADKRKHDVKNYVIPVMKRLETMLLYV